MVRRRGERRLRYAADGLDVLRDLGLRQEAAIARLCALADLDEDARRVRLHVRHGLDDAVPAEVAGCNLDDEVLEVIRFEELYRHAALTRAHADRQATLLVEVADSECDSFPGARRQRTDGHIGEDQRVDPVYRRRVLRLDELAVLDGKWQLLGREHAAERRADVEGVARGIERRVRHLRDAADDDRVERALCVEVRAAAALDGAVVLREQGLARIRVADRMNGIIRADLLADAAAAAEIREARDLLDDRAHAMDLLRLRHRLFRHRQGLAADRYLDGLEGAGCHAAAAHRAAIGMIFDYPGQVIDAHVLSLYCFHLCTSRSLSITTISRSFG